MTSEIRWDLYVAQCIEIQVLERGYWDPTPWHVEFPTTRFPWVEELKAAYVHAAQHGRNGLGGIRFIDKWPTIGQKFTYDIAARTWDR